MLVTETDLSLFITRCMRAVCRMFKSSIVVIVTVSRLQKMPKHVERKSFHGYTVTQFTTNIFQQ